MATTTNITTSYAGAEAMLYVSAALLSAPTLENGGVDIVPNIKFRKTLRPANITDIIKDSTCDFDGTGSFSTVERPLEPKKLQVNQQFCKEDFIDTWDALEMGFSAHDEIPSSFADFVIAEYVAQVAENNEISIWRGNATNTGEYDGFTTLIAADANLPVAQEVTGTTVDSDNVIAEMGKVVDALPDRLYGKEDIHIYVATNVFKAYKRALADLGVGGINNAGNNQDINVEFFDGIKVFMTQGLLADTMVATRKSNLKFGTGL